MKISKKDSPKFEIDPKSSALLVIDMQNAFLSSGPFELPGGLKIVPGIKDLILRCRQLGILVAFTRVYHDDMDEGVYPNLFPDHFDKEGKPRLTRSSPIFQIVSELAPTINDLIIDKGRYSAFYQTELEAILRKKGIGTLFIVGLATNVCCESTARDAFFRNFRVIVLSDLNVTYSKEAHEASLENIRNCFGFVVESSELRKMLPIVPMSQSSRKKRS